MLLQHPPRILNSSVFSQAHFTPAGIVAPTCSTSVFASLRLAFLGAN